MYMLCAIFVYTCMICVKYGFGQSADFVVQTAPSSTLELITSV